MVRFTTQKQLPKKVAAARLTQHVVATGNVLKVDIKFQRMIKRIKNSKNTEPTMLVDFQYLIWTINSK